MDTQILQDLGFTNAEIKIYLALLELGPSTAGPIIEKSELQSSVVHMAINKLINKGFVSFVKQGQRNHYQATNPGHISEYIDEKKKQFEELLPKLINKGFVSFVKQGQRNHYQATNPEHISEYIDEKKKQFEELLPKLIQKQKGAKQKSEVVTFRGIKGIRELLQELLMAGGKEHNTMGSAKESLMMGDTFWLNYHNKRAAKGIKAKLIFNESLKQWVDVNKYPKAEYKFTKSGFEPLTETIIRNDKIGIIIWTEVPVGILIHNKVAAKSYDNFFEILWKQGKK